MRSSYQDSYGHHVLGGSHHSRYSDSFPEYWHIHEHSQHCHRAHIHQHLHIEKERWMIRQNQELLTSFNAIRGLLTRVCKFITHMVCQQTHFIWSMLIQPPPPHILSETVTHAQHLALVTSNTVAINVFEVWARHHKEDGCVTAIVQHNPRNIAFHFLLSAFIRYYPITNSFHHFHDDSL